MSNSNLFSPISFNSIIPIPEDEIEIIILINQIVSGLSIFLCVLVFIMYWFFKEIRNFIIELSIWLCVSNCLYNITAFFPYDNEKSENQVWCGLQSFMIVMFQNSCWMWSCIIGYCCFIGVIKKNHIEKNKTKYRIFFVLLATIIPASLASIIIFTDAYGPTGGWCWLDVYQTNGNKFLIRKLILFFYCVNWFFIILNTFFLFKVIGILNKQVNKSNRSKVLLGIYHVLKWFPIAQIICVIPSTINRIYNVLGKPPHFVLIIFQTIFGSILGVCYFIIYIRIPYVKHALQIFYCKVFKIERSVSKDAINDNEIDDNLIQNPLI